VKRPVLAVAVAIAALATVTAACSNVTDPTVLRVNGHDVVSASELKDDLAGLGKVPSLAQQVQGSTPGTTSTTFSAQMLRLYMFTELLRQEADRRGIAISQAELDQARADFAPRWQSSRGTDFSTLPDHVQQEFLDQLVLVDKLEPVVGNVSDADVQKAYTDNPKNFTEVCVSHILVDTEPAAQAVLAELSSGKSFADVAKEKGTDATKDTGGQLRAADGSCLRQSAPVDETTGATDGFEEGYDKDFVTAALAAKPGTPTQPVKTQFGYHIILLEKPLQVLPFDQVKDEARSVALGGTTAVDTYLAEATKNADVYVDPRFGTFADGTITPPASKSTATTQSGSSDTTQSGSGTTSDS